MTLAKCFSVSLFGIIVLAQSSSLMAENKMGCKSVEALELKCGEYEAQSKACADIVQIEGKKKIDAAKQEQADCKSKNGATYMLKCKKEVQKATTLVNTPKTVLNSNIEKEQLAVADSPCAKAAAIGKEQVICKGPKKVVESMKANCVKDM